MQDTSVLPNFIAGSRKRSFDESHATLIHWLGPSRLQIAMFFLFIEFWEFILEYYSERIGTQ